MPIAITDEHQELAATVRALRSAQGALAANRVLGSSGLSGKALKM